MTSTVDFRVFAESLETPREARRWIARIVGTRELADAYGLQLVVSEVVTNAVRHAGGPVGVTVCVHNCGIWVSVADHGVGRVQRRNPSLTDLAGRGMNLVQAVSDSWGVIAEPGGKSVWFEISDKPPSLARA